MKRKKIGMFINHLRLKHQMSREELADRLGVFEIKIEFWEKGILMPSICELEMLSIQLDTSVNELLAGRTLKTKSDDEVFAYAEELRKKESLKVLISCSILLLSVITLVRSSNKQKRIGENRYER